MAMASASARYSPVYTIISRLGTEGDENGEKPMDLRSGEVISNAARFHTASVGKMRLETMPTFTAACAAWMVAAVYTPGPKAVISEPNCSIQPPMKARPYKPNTTPPVARVEKVLLHISVNVITTRLSR